MKLFYSNTIPTRRGLRCGIKDLEDGEYCVSIWSIESYYYKRVGNDLYHRYVWNDMKWMKETTNKYPCEDSSPVEIIDETQVPTPCPYV
jgi:hypothetical protein